MQINNLTDASHYSRIRNYTGTLEPKTKKVRYKHYEELNNEALKAYSVAKAYNSVQKGNKAKLLKSIPMIAQALIISSLSLTHPGKLAAKAGVGLGLLVTLLGFDKVTDFTDKALDKLIDKKEEKTGKQVKPTSRDTIKTFASLGAAIVGVPLLALAANKGLKVLQNPANKLTKFIAHEKNQLVSELNNTKLAKFMNEKVNPFINKHQKGIQRANFILPFATVAGATVVESKLLNSISKDISIKTTQNYLHGKMVQQKAKEHFDNVEAIEV